MIEQQDIKEKEENKIKIILDSNDINGFALRFLEFIIAWIVLANVAHYMAQIDFGISFLVVTVFWLGFLFYKTASIRANAYEQIINDLEEENEKLKKGNRLLENMLKQRNKPNF